MLWVTAQPGAPNRVGKGDLGVAARSEFHILVIALLAVFRVHGPYGVAVLSTGSRDKPPSG